MTGRRFGRLTVISDAGNNKYSNAQWLCLCDCGATKTVGGRSLRVGKSQSCGCVTLEVNRSRMTRHGKTGTCEHNIWLTMRDRCRNPKNHKFSAYGGRGIAVCDRWNSFEAFLADMGPRPTSRHSIDRIDNDGNYEPDNCRWATSKEQRANQRAST
jgi:hypothetical protein